MVKILEICLVLFVIQSCASSTVATKKEIHPALVAHRGGMITYPENSLVAFENAIKYTQYIEMDIRFSKDNVPVIFHDKELLRTTNCDGLVIEKDWIELKKCKLRERLDWNYSNYYIAKFQDVLKSHLLQDAILFIEIKEDNRIAINQLLNDIEMDERIRIESFDIDVLQYIYDTFHFENLYLISNDFPTVTPDFLQGLIVKSQNVTASSIVEQENVEIYIWTVDKEEEFKKYYQYDINGIITNDVRYFKKYYN
jgi:glycerophosphoryl diester phosphodiesterase